MANGTSFSSGVAQALEAAAMFSLTCGPRLWPKLYRVLKSTGIVVLGIASSLPVAAQMVEQEWAMHCDEAKTQAEYQAIVEHSPQSSLANYCLGDSLFKQKNYQASVNAYRSALRGDGYPTWTKVWSHIQIGKIFDVTEQRDRAMKEYALAVQTGDNTRGAVYEALELQQKPYESSNVH